MIVTRQCMLLFARKSHGASDAASRSNLSASAGGALELFPDLPLGVSRPTPSSDQHLLLIKKCILVFPLSCGDNLAGPNRKDKLTSVSEILQVEDYRRLDRTVSPCSTAAPSCRRSPPLSSLPSAISFDLAASGAFFYFALC